MPKSSKVSTGEILHTVGVRILVSGAGNLELFLQNLPDTVTDLPTQTEQLASVTMSTAPAEPTQLANFNNQYTQVRGRTTAINETFEISRIIVFVKPQAAEYPR